jgi:hypothetical protein
VLGAGVVLFVKDSLSADTRYLGIVLTAISSIVIVLAARKGRIKRALQTKLD